MNPPATATRTLSTADARREAVLKAAVDVFADRGFSGTPTTEVAKAAGISHAYLFRLYPTKSELAVAVVERCHDRIFQAFAEAAATAKVAGEDPLHAMGLAYRELLADRSLVLLQLHSHASAADDPALRDAAQAGFARLVGLVERETDADAIAVGSFFATGMLMNVMAALGALDSDAHWAQVLTSFCLTDAQE
jgi:AcrR family transcriptional regulator